MSARFTMDYITDIIQRAVVQTRKEIDELTPAHDLDTTKPVANGSVDLLLCNLSKLFSNEMGPEFNAIEAMNLLRNCGVVK